VRVRYHALAADYDGTLATHGVLDDDTRGALRRLRDSGRKLVMVTGRELDELLGIAGNVDAFDRIVAENGALIYEPQTKQIRTLCDPPPVAFADELRRRGVEHAVGRVIVASHEPYQDTILAAIRDLGLELQVIFNKGSVMVLPSGVNKATGLARALGELGLSPHNVVAIGDAENDHALLASCEAGAAVANALVSLKTKADLVTTRTHGAGVAELIDRIVRDDLADLAGRLLRHAVAIARDVAVDPYATTMMICGTSGSGKSTLTNAVLEHLAAGGYQFAIVDPEGDYRELETAVVLGSTKRAPLVEEALDVMRDPARNCVVNMLGIALDHRPESFGSLTLAFAEMRARVGRPHWIVIDEAHHMLPVAWAPSLTSALPERGAVYITVHPGSVSPAVLATIDVIVALGDQPARTIAEMCAASHREVPAITAPDKLEPGTALLWRVGEPTAAVIAFDRPNGERTRHSRKYTEGNLGADRSFYFRGPGDRLNLKAHNLQLFLQIGDGVDDETWEFHRTRGDFSRWLRDQVKDDSLADEVAAVEQRAMSPTDSRAAVRTAIDRRYTLPADVPTGLIDET
jgi:hypothetical protein